MFTASRNQRNERKSRTAGSTAMLIAVLLLANIAAIAGLGTTAHAASFPDALHYAPMTWEKEIWEKAVPADTTSPASTVTPQAATANAAKTADAPAKPQTVATPQLRHNFVEVSEETGPTSASIAAAARTHRLLLIALMSAALATMAGVSAMMFRSLAREISETERRRSRF